MNTVKLSSHIGVVHLSEVCLWLSILRKTELILQKKKWLRLVNRFQNQEHLSLKIKVQLISVLLLQFRKLLMQLQQIAQHVFVILHIIVYGYDYCIGEVA